MLSVSERNTMAPENSYVDNSTASLSYVKSSRSFCSVYLHRIAIWMEGPSAYKVMD